METTHELRISDTVKVIAPSHRQGIGFKVGTVCTVVAIEGNCIRVQYLDSYGWHLASTLQKQTKAFVK